MKQAIKVHEEKCDKSDLMCNINNKQESIPNHLYSMMHVLEDGFSIMMYGGTHDTNMFNGCVHRKHAVRLVLNNGIGVMRHESLYHSGAKSRQRSSGFVKANLRLFMCLWPFIEKNQCNIHVGTTDGAV